MTTGNNHIQPFSVRGKKLSSSMGWLVLAISGLSFCFFLGFPFAKHNETYIWVSILNKVSFFDTLTKQVINIESFRPLGMASAWLTYRLSGNIYLQEILNWLFATISFFILFVNSNNRPLFSLAAFVGCACFFAGYIYLFHLHGVFYGPFQLYVASLTWIACKKQRLDTRMLIITAVATFVVCLYHTFALLVFCGYLSGYIVQLIINREKKGYAVPVIALLLTLVLAKIILQGKELKTIHVLADGLIASYRLSEANNTLAVIAAILAVFAAGNWFTSKRYVIVSSGAMLALAILFMYLQLPVLILWVLACSAKMIFEKKWALAALVGATAILPLGSGSGSPTYVVFVLMVCTFITASVDGLLIPDTTILRRIVLAVTLVFFVCQWALKIGVRVPLLADAAMPILAEQEKTQQFKNILSWKMENKEYSLYSLVLSDTGGLPVGAKNVITRINRPVTGQADVNAYLDFFAGGMPNAQRPSVLYVTFGDKILKEKALVFAVNGPWNGKAYVFR